MSNIHLFQRKKVDNIPITMTTCYEYWSAKILSETEIDAVLVGDSLASVVHGYENTIPADISLMKLHIKAVKRGLSKNIFLIADMPFLAHRKSLENTMECVDAIIKAGANAIKLEGVAGNEKTIQYIVESGIPVMGHIGFTPQSIHAFGNKYVQGRDEHNGKTLITYAKILEQCGCFSIVLECIPSSLAGEITKSISIPTIGIGAGQETSGQVLVLHDLLGMNPEFNPKFLKKYLNCFDIIKSAVNQYCLEVKDRSFPNTKHCYDKLCK